MGMTNYEGPGEIYVNARLLAEATRCTARVKANNNPVTTMKKGLAGKSDGARSSEISIESAIPRKGYESDFIKFCTKGDYVRVVIKSGGKRHTFTGWIEDVEWNNSVDAPALISCNFMGSSPDSVG